MVNLGPLTPVNADSRVPQLRRTAATQVYGFKQTRSGLFVRERHRNYWTVVYEDKAGRRHASTSPDFKRVQYHQGIEPRSLARVPTSIQVSVGIVFICAFIACTVLLGGLCVLPNIYGGFWGYPRVMDAIQRKRFEREVTAEDYDLPPLLSETELEQSLIALAQPGEDQSHAEPAPIPLPQLLRGRAWLHWEDRKRQYSGERRFKAGQAHIVVDFESQLRAARESLTFLRERNPGHIDRKAMTVKLEAAITDLENRLDALTLPHSGLRRLTDENGRPQLSRGFEPKTDCQNGHVGLHYAGEFVIGTDRERRVPRACRWCESEWTELAR